MLTCSIAEIILHTCADQRLLAAAAVAMEPSKPGRLTWETIGWRSVYESEAHRRGKQAAGHYSVVVK